MKSAQNDMKFKTASFAVLFFTIFSLSILTAGHARGQEEAPFPTYGSGAVQVCIYTDYFCPPCRGMEPAVEPILRDLIKRNVIRVTLVDTPFSNLSVLYSRYFLYALNARNDFEHALRIRNTLFEAAASKNITTKEGIEGLFKSKGIPAFEFEPKSVFDRYNALIKQDKIDATPTCVIIRKGKKEKFVGGPDIIKALKGLK